MELESLLDRLESDLVERKAPLANKDRVCEAICAFANDLPDHRKSGIIFIGANDNGTPSSCEIMDQLLRELADLRANGNIVPFPTMRVESRTLKGAPIAVVFVEPSDAPPVRYQGRTWVRVGPKRAVATREDERRLSEKRRTRDLSAELLPYKSATLDDLDIELFLRTYLPAAVAPEVLDENERSPLQQLASLRLAKNPANGRPTNLGILGVGVLPHHNPDLDAVLSWEGMSPGIPLGGARRWR